MQAQTPQPPMPPIPQGEPVSITVVQTGGAVPQTFAEVRALRAQRTELSNQLQSAQRRRNEIVEQLRDASPAERPGLEARLKVLDDRILNVEQEIARTGELIAKAPGNLLTTSETSPAVGAGAWQRVDIDGIAIVFTIFVLAPIAASAARWLWKRGSAPRTPRIDAETQERLRRLESAVDSVAIEIERISEGQRFVTKLLSERQREQLPR